MAYTTATLTGKYETFDGQPASGVVEIIPNSRQLVDPEGDVILSGRVKVTLDETGAFSVTLPATDDATVEPATGRQYTVVAKLRHTHLAAVTGIELATGATVDVADLAAQPETDALVSPAATLAQLTALDDRVTTLETTPAVTSYNDLTDTPTLATVATTGAYTDLSGAPDFPTWTPLDGDTLEVTPGTNVSVAGDELVVGEAADAVQVPLLGADGLIADAQMPTRLGETALSATFGKKRGRRLALLGDSITVESMVPLNGDGSAYEYGFGYWPWAKALTRARFQFVTPPGLVQGSRAAFGAAGITAANIVAQGIHNDAAASDADVVVVLAGTNDIGADASAATIHGNLQTIWTALLNKGKTVVACTLTPRSDTAARMQALRDLNRRIRQSTRTTPGLLLCDWYSAVVDPTTGQAASNMYGDGVHPTDPGASRIGKVLADVLNPLVAGCGDNLGLDNADTADLLSNGLMLGNTGGVATGWTLAAQGAATVTPSKVPRTDLGAGEWQQIACTATAPKTDGYTIYAENTAVGVDWNIGDRVKAAIEFETDAGTWDCRSFQWQMFAWPIDGARTLYAEDREPNASVWRPVSGVLETPAFTIPTGTTRLWTHFRFRGTGTVRLGRAQLIKVTADTY